MWSPEDWQTYCMELLHLHYGPSRFQTVPDTHGGDLGIEGFSHDGCAYQCYAPEEPFTTEVLYERQRDKITIDLGKLAKYDAKLCSLLGTVRISNWILLVPFLNSRLVVEHATRKAREIRNAGLNCVADGFEVRVQTDSASPWNGQRWPEAP